MEAEGGTGDGMGGARAARAARAANGERENLPAHANAAAGRGTTKHNATTRTRSAESAARQGT